MPKKTAGGSKKVVTIVETNSEASTAKKKNPNVVIASTTTTTTVTRPNGSATTIKTSSTKGGKIKSQANSQNKSQQHTRTEKSTNDSTGLLVGGNVVYIAVVVACFVRCCRMAYNIRMKAIDEFGPVIHEFDPYFNLRATEVRLCSVRSSLPGSFIAHAFFELELFFVSLVLVLQWCSSILHLVRLHELVSAWASGRHDYLPRHAVHCSCYQELLV
jgi:hypothetical protein